MPGFWACLRSLLNLGLVETVAHLVDSDSDEGEIIHPMALGSAGLEVEREITKAAVAAAKAMITDGQYQWAIEQGVSTLVPVARHLENVQMVGIARLRYAPKTSMTAEFIERASEWRAVAEKFRELAAEAGKPDGALKAGS